MVRLLNMFISVLGAVTAIAMAWLASWLNAFGPELLVGGWVGNSVQTALWMGALGTVLAGSMRLVMGMMDDRPGRRRVTERVGRALLGVTWIVAFFAMSIAMWMMASAVEAMAFEERGKVTTCTVLRATERVETSTDSEGNTTTQIYYDHDLDCPTTQIGTMTTSERPAGEPGQSIAVRYDSRHRLAPRPEEDATRSGPLLRV